MSRVLVIGESCIDEFLYCRAERLAPDLPIPILEVEKVTTNPGMAANVHRNIARFIPSVELITQESWKETKKTRFVDIKTNHTFIRVDSKYQITPMTQDLAMAEFDCIVISDYNKGFLDEKTIEMICRNHDRVFLDTKKIVGSWANSALLIKINDYEYQRSRPFLDETLESKLIRTAGVDGCFYNGVHFPAHVVPVSDTSGAGDSFLAGLVIRYLESQDIKSSIEFANHCASRVVQERGVSTI